MQPTELFPLPELQPAIRGVAVPMFLAEEGPLHSLVFGEAPGPRGADKTGIPFWGDGAGLPLYKALVRAGCAEVPEAAWTLWDGAGLLRKKLLPNLLGVALSNAYPCCPAKDAWRFRAPTRSELQSPANVARLRGELLLAQSRGVKNVVTLGRCAQQTVEPLVRELGMGMAALPHPSAQGLLSTAPNRGKGERLSDLAAAWEERLALLLSAARGQGAPNQPDDGAL